MALSRARLAASATSTSHKPIPTPIPLHPETRPGAAVRNRSKAAVRTLEAIAFRALESGAETTPAFDQFELDRAEDVEREELASAVDSSTDGLLVMNPDWAVVYANPAMREILDRPLERLTSFRDVAAEMAGSAGAAEMERTAVAGKRWLGELTRDCAKGGRRYLQMSLTASRDAAGAIVRYVVVIRDVTSLREVQAEIALQDRMRLALLESMQLTPVDATLEQAATTICERLLSIPNVDVAAVEAFVDDADGRLIHVEPPGGHEFNRGNRMAATRARRVYHRTREGGWAEYVERDPIDDQWKTARLGSGIKAVAYGPILRGDELIGAIVIGTRDEHVAGRIVENVPALVSFGAASGGVLAEALYRLRLNTEARNEIAAMMAARGYHPVFQPIVDLETNVTVGYEALTRFDSGARPDLRFADAWAAGLGSELELATIAAAVEAAQKLPSGRWLDINVSPRLLADIRPLGEALRIANRPIVLEITEHEPIADYQAARIALEMLGRDVRIAVDDAGAGAANFGHIIELRPDFVKLDMSLVRRVNAHLGRQAMIIGMRHFSRTAGCRLIAEGAETQEEAATLRRLGVEFAQGYLYGKPEVAETWTASPPPRTGEQPRPGAATLP